MNKFIAEQKVDESILQQYEQVLPEKLLEFWRTFGFGSLATNYIKVINPNEYIDLLNSVYVSPINEIAIPIFITGLGDFIVWENSYTVLINLRKGMSEVVESGFDFFLDDLSDEDFLKEDLKNKNYPEIVSRSGELSFDECYAYFPLVELGGAEKVENLKKVKIKEYISIVAQSLGQIQ